MHKQILTCLRNLLPNMAINSFLQNRIKWVISFLVIGEYHLVDIHLLWSLFIFFTKIWYDIPDFSNIIGQNYTAEYFYEGYCESLIITVGCNLSKAYWHHDSRCPVNSSHINLKPAYTIVVLPMKSNQPIILLIILSHPQQDSCQTMSKQNIK